MNAFEGYRVSKLLEDKADRLRKETRLVLLGYGSFPAEHKEAPALPDRLKSPTSTVMAPHASTTGTAGG